MPIIDHTFNRRGENIEIVFHGGERITLSLENVQAAIENIKNGRENYATEASYQEALNLYTSARQFLLGNGAQ